MQKFKRIDFYAGILCFLVAAVTYCLTVEPTASFWDCPEFILSGNKLEVGHPPGAPFFMLTANVFSSFVSPDKVAYMVNIMSAMLSALGILFLFWSITHFTRKLIVGNSTEITNSQIITIIASGFVGALAYTWSDTYWFSAVEGEVYGYSSLFTAVVFWLILKWEECADEPHSDRWLVLIAYLVGLSIGVHLLNLLCIPAIVLVVYFKKSKKSTFLGAFVAFIISAVIVALVLYGIVPGIVKVGGWFELFFVNTLGMSFNSGLLVYVALLFAVIIAGIYASEKKVSTYPAAVSLAASIALLGIPFYVNGTFGALTGVLVVVAIGYIVAKYVSHRIMNTILLSLLTITIGYSSYAVILIRSAANTPMDQNSPEDIFTLGSYLNREQYGDRPLLYGQSFNSIPYYNQIDKDGYMLDYYDDSFNYIYDSLETSKKYIPAPKSSESDADSYISVPGKLEVKYFGNMLFPRMYSADPVHVNEYKRWVGDFKGEKVEETVKRRVYVQGISKPFQEGESREYIVMPTQGENLKFFFKYQLNHMYWRYFLWNFVGRQNDIQNRYGEKEYGNWLTGISFLDNARLGDQSLLPKNLQENKGRNVFFALPFILGILGIVLQCYRGREGKQQLTIIALLFFMTGIAIVLYLNQTPMQPRERDYAYAGSFYAFAIWIGIGVAAITQFVNKLLEKKSVRNKIISNSVVAALCMIVPLQMVSQTWDDHDRSGRYACRDFGLNYLNTLPDKGCPIIFTCGDNDTFPLWYNQETEGERTDVRVCNLSYLQTDWYIDQMRRPAYDSQAIKTTWEHKDYTGKLDVKMYFVSPESKSEIEAAYAEDPEGSKAKWGEYPYEVFGVKNVVKNWAMNGNIPTDVVYIPIDSAAVVRSGMMIPEIYTDAAGDNKQPMPKYMEINLPSRLSTSDIMILDMLANANWERPFYMSTTVGSSNYFSGLDNFFVQEGLAYRITPFNWTKLGYQGAPIDIEKTYNNVMNRYVYGGVKDNPDYYVDETIGRMISTHRRIFISLADELIIKGDYDRALEVVKKCEEVFPPEIVPYDVYHFDFLLANAFFNVGEYDRAFDISLSMLNDVASMAEYLSDLDERDIESGYDYVSKSRKIIYVDELYKIINDENIKKSSKYSSNKSDIERCKKSINSYVKNLIKEGSDIYRRAEGNLSKIYTKYQQQEQALEDLAIELNSKYNGLSSLSEMSENDRQRWEKIEAAIDEYKSEIGRLYNETEQISNFINGLALIYASDGEEALEEIYQYLPQYN